MKLEKAKLNPNSVNDRATRKMEKPEQTMNRKGVSAKGKQVNPKEVPTTMGYVGKRISR